MIAIAALSLNSRAFADVPALDAPANNVETHMANIVDRVRQCSVLPYTLRNGVKVYHHLVSHCPEVKVLEKGRAKIKVGGHTFTAQLIDTRDTDGDIYNVEIRDYISNDAYTLEGVFAYGDVMLGILNGNIKKIPQVYVNNPAYMGQFE